MTSMTSMTLDDEIVRQLQRERDAARAEARQFSLDIEALCSELSDARAQIERGEGFAIVSANGSMNGAREAALLSSLREEREKARAAAEDARMWQERAVRSVEDGLRLEAAQSDAHAARARVEAVEATLATHMEEREMRDTESRRLLEEAKAETESLRARLSGTEKALTVAEEEAARRIATAEEVRHGLRAQLDELEEKARQREAELAEMGRTLAKRDEESKENLAELTTGLQLRHNDAEKELRREIDELNVELSLYRDTNATWAERVGLAAREKVEALLALSQSEERINMMANQLSQQEQQIQHLRQRYEQAANEKVMAVMSEAKIRNDRDGLQHQQQSLVQELLRVSNSTDASGSGGGDDGANAGEPRAATSVNAASAAAAAAAFAQQQQRQNVVAGDADAKAPRRKSWLQQLLPPTRAPSSSLSTSSSPNLAGPPRRWSGDGNQNSQEGTPLPSSSTVTVAPVSPSQTAGLPAAAALSRRRTLGAVDLSSGANDEDSIKMLASISLQNAKWREEMQTASNIASSACKIADTLQELEADLRHCASVAISPAEDEDTTTTTHVGAMNGTNSAGSSLTHREDSGEKKLVAAEKEIRMLGLAVSATATMASASDVASGKTSSIPGMVLYLLEKYVRVMRIAIPFLSREVVR